MKTKHSSQKKPSMPAFHKVLQMRSNRNQSSYRSPEGSHQTYRASLPKQLKTNIETMSGLDLSATRVHKNSQIPGRINSLAFAYGQDIYLSPGAEKHLAHEAWHVAQQLQGRVNPVTRINGTPINNETYLEREADIMGKMALTTTPTEHRNDSINQTQTPKNKAPVAQLTLQDDMQGSMDLAVSELISSYDGESGIIARQKQAVYDFADAVQVNDPPSVSERILIGAINLALGSALGSIGSVLKTLGRRALQPALRAATQATFSSAIDSSQVRSVMRSSLDGAVDSIVSAGKSTISSAVSEAFDGSAGDAPTPALKFRAAQEHALTQIGRAQTRAIHIYLARLAQTEGEEDDWAVINALYEAFQEGLSSAYDEQYNKMTDAWFAMQVTSLGLGARPGVLQIELASRYPNRGSFRITSGNLVGEGANSTVRHRLSSRKLEDIGIPKVIRMNGSMGYGILDIMWNITVTGQERPSSQPTIRAPSTRSRAEAYMFTEQHVTRIGGNRWGPAWLAAYHLRLADLDVDDPRNNAENQSRGAREVWQECKNKAPGTIGNSTW